MIRNPTARPRRGALTVVVLVCLLILTLIAGAILRAGAAHREEMRTGERRLQAEWLAEAGLQRAAARLAADAGYAGETWDIPARELDSADDATVAITVERPAGDARRRTIRARADYPRDPPRRARATRQMTTFTTD
jgi:type II secretory pathway component PulK